MVYHKLFRLPKNDLELIHCADLWPLDCQNKLKHDTRDRYVWSQFLEK